MPITLITGPANAGKAREVLDRVEAHLAREEDPVLVVPTAADVEHYQRELAGASVAFGATVERFDGLIADVVDRAGVGRPAIGRAARERVLADVLTAWGRRPAAGAVRGLGELFAELRVRRVTPARLHRALDRWIAADGPEVAGAGLAGAYRRYVETLERLQLADFEQRAVLGLDALREQPSRWLGTPVLLYGFDDLTRLQIDTIETLGRLVDAEVTVSLTFERARRAFAGRAAAFQALAPIAAEHRELAPRDDHYAPESRPALAHLERSLFEPDAARIEDTTGIGLLQGAGERSELELLADEVRELLDAGVAPHEIAIVARASSTSYGLLEEVLAAAGVPHAMRQRRPLGRAGAGRALLGLLRCVPDAAGGCAGDAADLIAWLRASGSIRRPELIDRLEAAVRRSGASTVAEARELWEERGWRLDAIDRLATAQERGPVALAKAARRELERMFSAPRRREAAVLGPEGLEDAAATVAAHEALAELVELAGRGAELLPRTAGELAQTLASVEYLAGSPPADGAVAVLDPLALRARRMRVVFVCGLQERAFPARQRRGLLLGEDELQRLAEVSGLRLAEGEDELASERHLMYEILSRPEQRLMLCWHLADDDGEPTPRSLFVDDVLDLYAGEPELRTSPRDPAPAAGAQATPRPASTPSGMRVLGERALLEQLGGRTWSASSVERFLACPVAWFVERMLSPGPLDPDPEPLVRGGLAHAALKDTLERLRAETGSARVTAASLARARELLADALRAHEPDHPLSSVPERRGVILRRLRADLERFLAVTAEAGGTLEPGPLELAFGFAADDPRGEGSSLAGVDLGEGVTLRGRIDRIDVDGDGGAVVYDYKGGNVTAGARWLKDGRLQVALYMLAAEQLLGLRAIGGFYQPLSGERLEARGVLESGTGLELDCVATDLLEPAEMRELLDACARTAREAAHQAGRGEFDPRPATCAYQGGCAYPAICRCER